MTDLAFLLAENAPADGIQHTENEEKTYTILGGNHRITVREYKFVSLVLCAARAVH
jgi:hypothetical protein